MALFDANNVAAWKLTSGALETDTGGAGNNLTLTNNGTITATTGWSGAGNTAASFDGSTQYFTRASSAALVLSTAFSIRIRFYLTANVNGTNYYLLAKGTGSTMPYYIYVAGATAGVKVQMRLLNPAGTLVNVIQTDFLAVNAWYEVTFTYDGTTMHAYAGAKGGSIAVSESYVSSSFTGAINSNTGSLYIGSNASAASKWVGKLDDVMISDRVWSFAEVQEAFALGDDFAPVTTGTIAATLDGVSANIVGGQTTGTIGATLDGVSASIVCNQLIPIGTIAVTLEGVSASISASIKNIATISATLDGVSAAINAAVPTVGTIGATLAGVSAQILGATSSVVENFECKIRHKTTGAGITGLTAVKMRAWQPSTGLRFDFSDNTFRTTPTTPEIVLSEIDAVNDPGLYRVLVTTTLWSGWISAEITYNDGTYTYSYQGEGNYVSGIRASGARLPSEVAQLNDIGSAVSVINAAVALISGYTDSIESRLPAALVGGKMDSNIGSVRGTVVGSGTGTASDPWGP